MVKISIPEVNKNSSLKPILKKEVNDDNNQDVEEASCEENENIRLVLVTRRRRFQLIWMTMLTLSTLIFVFLGLKTICNLKEENLRLMRELRMERTKDAALKRIVHDKVPRKAFPMSPYTEQDIREFVDKAYTPSETSFFSIHLSVIWTSDDLTPCDMVTLFRSLTDEIYGKDRFVAEEAEYYKMADQDERIAPDSDLNESFSLVN